MSILKLQPLFEYFDVWNREDQRTLKRLEYIARFLEDLTPDEQFRVLKKIDVNGPTEDRIAAVWKHFRFNDITRDFVNQTRPVSTWTGQESSIAEPSTISVKQLFPPDIKVWGV